MSYSSGANLWNLLEMAGFWSSSFSTTRLQTSSEQHKHVVSQRAPVTAGSVFQGVKMDSSKLNGGLADGPGLTPAGQVHVIACCCGAPEGNHPRNTTSSHLHAA